MKQEKRLFNLRLFFIGFVGMIFGILAFYNLLNILFLNKAVLWFVVFAFAFAVNVVILILFIIIKSCRRYLKYVISFTLLFIVGFGLFSIHVNKIMNLKTYNDPVEINGVVSSCYYSGTGYVVELRDVVVNDIDEVNNVKVYVICDDSTFNGLVKGYTVKMSAELTLQQLVTDKINISRFVNGCGYSAYAKSSSISIVNKSQNLIDLIQSNLESTLDNGLSNENADIAYGVLVGDKDELNDSVKNSFSYAGISHILAVSGLHVGFLVLAITFILNLFRVGRRNRFLITSIFLVFYCFICGFSPSVLRASFMSIILLLAGVVGKEYDGLNSIGLAGIIILLISPVDLFNLGFQLSFMCVFMIITMADKLGRWMISLKIPGFVATPICISVCTTIGSSIILANSLYEISIASLVSNLIVIPLFSVIYPLLFVGVVVAMIIPAFSGVLILPEIMLHLVKLIANLFASIEFAHFRVFKFGYFSLFIFVLLAFIVKFLMCKKIIKGLMSLVLSVLVVILVAVGVAPTRFEEFALYTNYQYSTNSAVITTNSNKKILIGIDNYSTNSFLTNLKIDKLDILVLPDFQVNKIDELVEFLRVIKVDKVVIPTNTSFVDKVFDEIKVLTTVEIVDYYNSEIKMGFLKSENVVCGTKIDVNGKTLLFTNGITKSKLGVIGEMNCFYDYIITNESKYDFETFGIDYGSIIYSNELNFIANCSISLKNKSLYMLKL